ncbi:MAG: FAD/NAD(P)-binding protein [Betaproteobacteria bacterium]|nr:FAD/NAD(P)-binding protein [Betaproteobacteria bacterium]
MALTYDLVVIGAGLSGTAFLWHLAEALKIGEPRVGRNSTGLRLLVLDRQVRLGPGLPHNADYVLPFHITNMCAGEMGVCADAPGDFQRWVAEHREKLLAEHPEWAPHFEPMGEDLDDCAHFPRAVMGEYLQARCAEALARLRERGVEVEVQTHCEALDLQRGDSGFRITARRLEADTNCGFIANRVLLTTGHWLPERSAADYFPAVWPASALARGIPNGARVLVLGSSLSAIETALTLSAEGDFRRASNGRLEYQPPPYPRRLSLCSRSGQLPRVRGRRGHRVNQVLTEAALAGLGAKQRGTLRLSEVMSLLDAELRLAYGGAFDWARVMAPSASPLQQLSAFLREAREGDGAEGEVLWQTVLAPLLAWASRLYLCLEKGERDRFDREFTTLFFLHAATQPARNAEKLLALLEAGVVEVIKLGESYRLERDTDKGCWQLTHDHGSSASPAIDGGVSETKRRPGAAGPALTCGEEAPSLQGGVTHNERGDTRRADFDFVVDARGQQGDYRRNPTPLARALCRSEWLVLTEGVYRSVAIDRQTHAVLGRGRDGRIAPVGGLYAFGAMTRGQMLDASMARGLVLASAQVARSLAREFTASP